MGDERIRTQGAAAELSAAVGGKLDPLARVGSSSPQVGYKAACLGIFLLLLAYLPALMAYGAHLWQRPHFQFFPMALLGAGVLAWRGLKEHSSLTVQGSLRPMLGLIGVAFSLLLLSAVLRSPWLGTLSAIALVLALGVGAGGRPLIRTLISPLIMILVLVCLPLDLDRAFVLGLRRFAVQTSGYLLDALRVPYFLSGNIVEIRGNKLLVDEACSGINSAFFILASSLFYGLWRKRGRWHMLFVALASVSFVLLGNVLRISGGVCLSYRWKINVLSGWPHELLGLILFAVYVGLILSVDLLICRLTQPVGFVEQTADAASATPVAQPDIAAIVGRAMGHVPFKWGIVLVLAFLFTGMFQARWLLFGQRFDWQRMAVRSAPQLKPGSTFALPATMVGWQRLEKNQYDASVQERVMEDRTQLRTHSWAFRNGPLVVLVSIDYPYYQQHDLNICYIGAGWTINESKMVFGEGGASFVEIGMRKKPFSNGYLLYGTFQSDGRWFEGIGGQLRVRLGERSGPVYQVQALVVTTTPLTSDQKGQVRGVFEATRKMLIQQVLAQLEKQP